MQQHILRNPQRKKNRLSEYDYSQAGYYFVTICTKDRKNLFGEIEDDKMILNKIGKMSKIFWEEIPKHFLFVELDEYIIMPNHIHGIIIIDNVGDNHGCPLQKTKRNMELLPKIISQYKSSVTRQIHKQFNDYKFAWQKSFYDHIIRNGRSLSKIQSYIIYNPLKWDIEQNKIENIFM